jgi:hypothetical protein
MIDDPSFLSFSQTARDVCNYICIALLLILLFIMSPLRHYSFLSILGKIFIFLFLGWAVYRNMKNAQELTEMMSSGFLDGSWDSVKSNIVCSYILTFFIIVLMLTVLQHLFR